MKVQHTQFYGSQLKAVLKDKFMSLSTDNELELCHISPLTGHQGKLEQQEETAERRNNQTWCRNQPKRSNDNKDNKINQ